MARRRRKHLVPKGGETNSKTKRTKQQDGHDVVVLFADVVGCSEISNHKSLADYNDFITSFQECFRAVCSHYEKEEYVNNEDYFDYQSRGDEGCLKIFVPNRTDLSMDIHIAINIALDLKRKWLLEEENRKRVNNGLLPVDIGIGIHSGRVWVNKEKKGIDPGFRPEGYVINLAKRIESASRRGKFSHILISESARGELHLLKDEITYRFGKPFTIDPKGISRDIKVFEIMHHFLPTNWQEEIDKPTEVSIVYGNIKKADVNTVREAYNSNPMNLWLAEELIILEIMHSYHKLDKKGQGDNNQAIRKAYLPALETARQVANSNLRDAGVLALLGYVLGEFGDYKEEQQMYEEGLKLDDQDALLHWYLAYSLSVDLDEARKDKKSVAINDFYEANSEKIEKTLEEYRRAFELMPMNAWIVYDYACEQSWWSQVKKGKYRAKAINLLIQSFGLNSAVIEKANEEEFLDPIIDDPKVKQYVQK